MSNVLANANKDKSKIYQTVLSSPGMNEKCKIVLMISRQNVLLLGRLIENGLLPDKGGSDDEIIRAIPSEALHEMQEIHEDILKKSNLTEFYEKLKLL